MRHGPVERTPTDDTTDHMPMHLATYRNQQSIVYRRLRDARSFAKRDDHARASASLKAVEAAIEKMCKAHGRLVKDASAQYGEVMAMLSGEAIAA